ncbi:hypothetical protein J3R83DRAFT_7275 [Lanmaoa asiatica]|nr:hypothetical protein J3R83DRAFT_7275 [Lanmaoa asiatica]
MKLPCLAFKLGRVSPSGPVFCAQTAALGIVEIRTKEDLCRFDSLYLIYPWIDFLLDRQLVRRVTETVPKKSIDDQSSSTGELSSFLGPSNTTSPAAWFVTRLGLSFSGQLATLLRNVPPLPPPSSESRIDKQMQALRLIARIRQPFGALLFTPNRQNVPEYRRVASESMITVQVEEITPMVLNELVDGVRTLDVL